LKRFRKVFRFFKLDKMSNLIALDAKLQATEFVLTTRHHWSRGSMVTRVNGGAGQWWRGLIMARVDHGAPSPAASG
jgi:hypothetical protein